VIDNFTKWRVNLVARFSERSNERIIKPKEDGAHGEFTSRGRERLGIISPFIFRKRSGGATVGPRGRHRSGGVTRRNLTNSQ